MDADTLALMRVLQGGPYERETLGWIRDRMRLELPALNAADDREGIVELLALFEGWAECAPAPLAAEAYVDVASIADVELDDAAHAQQLLTLSIDLDPTHLEAILRLEVLLAALGQRDQLQGVVAMQARALQSLPDADPATVAHVFALHGRLRVEHSGDATGAIEACETALDAYPDADTLSELAGLYMFRAQEGDAAQAAELFCALAGVLEGQERVVALQFALDNEPEHEEAMGLLEDVLSVDDPSGQLPERWRAYLEAAPEGPGAEGRRRSLAQALIAEGQHEQALEVLRPLSEQGNEIAEHMRENILQSRADAGEPIRPAVPASRSGHTQVGFRLPELTRPRADPARIAALLGVGSRLRASLKRRPAPGSESVTAQQPGAGLAPATSPGPVAASAAPILELSAAEADPPYTREPASAVAMTSAVDESVADADFARLTGIGARGLRMALVARRFRAMPPLRLAAVVACVMGVFGGLWMLPGGESPDTVAVAAPASPVESSIFPAAVKTVPAATPIAATTAVAAPSARHSAAKARRVTRAAKSARARASVTPVRRLARSSGGKLKRSELLEAINRSVPGIERCYRRALKRKPRLAGRMTFSLRVRPNGRVVAVKRSRGTIRDKAIARCAISAIKRTRFPRPRKKVARVSFPMRFVRG